MPYLTLQVETAPDKSGYGMPVSFMLHGRIFIVREILDRWSGVDHCYFKLVAGDGATYILRHDHGENEWEMVLMEMPEPGKGR